MSVAFDAVLAEFADALEQIEPRLEGLHDFARLDLQPDAGQAIGEDTIRFEERIRLIRAAQDALLALSAHGYPDTLNRSVAPSTFSDLKANRDTIDAALGIYSPLPEAATGEIATGKLEPQA